MDNSNLDSRNLLMELESLKSKQCIFKMKEANYIKDKEILEDSIRTLQQDLQEKSEVIRSLRKELDSQSSHLYHDAIVKNEELDKSILDINDLTKKLSIAMETIDYHIKRNETIKSEFEKQKNNYDRELEYKSRLVTFLETSNSQKESKISDLTYEINSLKVTLTNMEVQFEKQKNINKELENDLEKNNHDFTEERQKREQDLLRAKNEILQLQQSGISELYLEKMNPTVAATIKALKSSKGLMDIYSELHGVIRERDYLQLEKTRLNTRRNELEKDLTDRELEIERMTIKSKESLKMIDNFKNRLLGLVTELRTSEALKTKMEREVLFAKRKAEISEKEVNRLLEQVRVLIVGGDSTEFIKQEPVDVDSAMYTSVQELQEVNRALRNDNDVLRQRMEESDSEQFKQRCNDLQLHLNTLKTEVDYLRHENTSSRSLLIIHEKQVQMLRYLLELKNPGTNLAIEKALRSLEEGIKGNVEIIGENEAVEKRLIEGESEPNNESNRISKLENDILEMIDNKRASDDIFIASIEKMRSDFINKNRLSLELQEKFEDLKEKFEEERESSEKYRKESELLRSINKNLSNNSSILEAQTEEIKLKLESKITEVAEKKAELNSCKIKLLSLRSQLTRLLHERDEFKKALNQQQEILTNISSLQNVVSLKDHLCLSNMQFKIDELEASLGQMNVKMSEKNDELSRIYDELTEKKAELSESMSMLNESRTLADACQDRILPMPEMCDAECQVAVLESIDEVNSRETDKTIYEDIDNVAVVEYKNMIVGLEDKLHVMITDQKASSEHLDACMRQIVDLSQKCEFYQSQLDILEKSKQEVLNENIKLTEEAHDLNASLKHDLHRHQEELFKMKVRLEEAENVERTAQSVIDKFAKECNEAKAKYKRELTLHAVDSKLLESLNDEIEKLKAKEDDEIEQSRELRNEVIACDEKWKFQLQDLRAQMTAIEQQLREEESRNDRLYQQLSQASVNEEHVLLNVVIDDLRNQINIRRLSDNLMTNEKEKYQNELERKCSEINDLQEQLSLEKNRSNLNISDSDLSSKNIETEIVMESNHTLRAQKTELERLVIGQKSQIDDLSDLVSRLKGDIVDLNNQSSSLVTVKAELEEERNRWKERCTKLIERAEQLDPEKYRAACNDRDRFERLLCERESSFKELLNKFNNEKDEINKLMLVIEEEKNKLKNQEAIVIQLKEIARKYKSDAEKKRQTIVELEDSAMELNNEKQDSMKTEEALRLKLEAIESELDLCRKNSKEENEKVTFQLVEIQSMAKELEIEKQELTVRLNFTEAEFQSQTDSNKKIIDFMEAEFQSQIDSNKKIIETLNEQYNMLQQDDTEKSMKLQLIENSMIRLTEENKQLRSKHVDEIKTAHKRGFDEELNVENEPELKRLKVTEAGDKRESDIHQEIDHQANETTNELNNTPKIWWNVKNTEDDEVIAQIQKNLEQFKTDIEVENLSLDIDMSKEHNISPSEEYSEYSEENQPHDSVDVGDDTIICPSKPYANDGDFVHTDDQTAEEENNDIKGIVEAEQNQSIDVHDTEDEINNYQEYESYIVDNVDEVVIERDDDVVEEQCQYMTVDRNNYLNDMEGQFVHEINDEEEEEEEDRNNFEDHIVYAEADEGQSLDGEEIQRNYMNAESYEYGEEAPFVVEREDYEPYPNFDNYKYTQEGYTEAVEGNSNDDEDNMGNEEDGEEEVEESSESSVVIIGDSSDEDEEEEGTVANLKEECAIEVLSTIDSELLGNSGDQTAMVAHEPVTSPQQWTLSNAESNETNTVNEFDSIGSRRGRLRKLNRRGGH